MTPEEIHLLDTLARKKIRLMKVTRLLASMNDVISHFELLQKKQAAGKKGGTAKAANRRKRQENI
jgi:Asp-tRNA(Asn)/Glu-tRNA(Gln) amidotransferase C subunit